MILDRMNDWLCLLVLWLLLVVQAAGSGLEPRGLAEVCPKAAETLARGTEHDTRKSLYACLHANPRDAGLAYTICALLARMGLDQDAMVALDAALSRGYSDYVWPLDLDPDLDRLRRNGELDLLILDHARVARRKLVTAIEEGHGDARSLAAAAALFSLDGDGDRALELLEQALALGFTDFRALESGRQLSRLRLHPRFKTVVSDAFERRYGWRGDEAQKLWGLMQVYAEVEHNFVFFDQAPEIDWTREVQSSISVVLEATTMSEYYHALAELVARLGDGHTGIVFPPAMRERVGRPGLELTPVGGKIIVTGVGESESALAAGVLRGDAVVTVDGVPVEDVLQQVLRFRSYSTPHADRAYGALQVLDGPVERQALVIFERPDGRRYQARLDRVAAAGRHRSNGEEDGEKESGEHHRVEEMVRGIWLVELSSFTSFETAREFDRSLASLLEQGLEGLIIDLRRNGGGESGVGWRIVTRLIDRPVTTSTWLTPIYRPAFKAWGRERGWYQGRPPRLLPAPGQRFSGPLVALVSARTFSAAEDFLVPLVHSGRATLIGARTGGSTGQPVMTTLPGGGVLRVCSKRDTFPNGDALVGRGIEPDIEVVATRQDIVSGRDPVLDRAVSEISRMIQASKGPISLPAASGRSRW